MPVLKGGYMGNWNATQEAYYGTQPDFSERPERPELTPNKLGTEPPRIADITKYPFGTKGSACPYNSPFPLERGKERGWGKV